MKVVTTAKHPARPVLTRTHRIVNDSPANLRKLIAEATDEYLHVYGPQPDDATRTTYEVRARTFKKDTSVSLRVDASDRRPGERRR